MRIVLGVLDVNLRWGPLGFQHGLMSISAVLKQYGYTDVHLAYFTSHRELAEWPEQLARLKPQVIGFYVASGQADQVAALINAVPRDGTFTIAGGPYPTCYPRFLEQVERLDAVGIGEGEYTMLELVQALEAGRDPGSVAGLRLRRDGAIIETPPRPFIENLDELPYEDWDLFDTQHSIDRYGLAQIRVMASRGCPYKCTYCSNHGLAKAQPGRYVRYRSVDHLLGELKMLKERFRFSEIFFDDDIFMLNRARLREFAERFPVEVGVSFVCSCRVEVADDESMTLLKKAGCRRVDFGIEHGDEALRREVLKRRMTNEQITRAVESARRAGLQVKTMNMVGLPGETPEKHLATLRLNQQLRPDVTECSVFWAYPGTELYELCVREGYLVPDTKTPKHFMVYRTFHLKLPGFSAAQVKRAYSLFCFRVFWKRNKIKALAYWLLYSRLGVVLVRVLSRVKKYARRIFTGM
jgi:anaerobic magnesium-protoporphyrin IX monomethyl ester cyclase